MTDLDRELALGISRLSEDRVSGATAILADALGLLTRARTLGEATTVRVARELIQAQPSMAPLWNAAVEAVADFREPGRFERFVQRASRSADAVARFAAAALADDDAPAHLVTISSSRSVWMAIEAVRRHRRLRISCSESRPALEGRRLAARLAAAGVEVTCYADAGIAAALADANAVLVGADAVAPEWFLNKSGTRMLAAAASLRGVPVYVAAAREKFVSDAVAARLAVREEAPEEIWADAPAGVVVRNSYFETVPLDLVTAVISDAGVLAAGMVRQACDAGSSRALADAIAQLTP